MKFLFEKTRILVLLGLLGGLSFMAVSCGKGKLFGEDPKTQKYKDVTVVYLKDLKPGIVKARPGFVNRDVFPDLVLLRQGDKGQPVVQVLISHRGKKFNPLPRTGWEGQATDRIVFMALQDLNHDQTQDLVLVGEFADGSATKVLFNSGKGYFYTKKEVAFPHVYRGMDRVDLRDIDGDGNIDLFFTGRRVVDSQGKPHKYQAQFIINHGKERFEDNTRLLLPPLKPGIVGTSFADYDGDGTLDVFLINGDGQNSLLLNNGLGKFTDRTADLLPALNDQSAAADWADFDQDGDNDILVVNRTESAPGEFGYFLVNRGNGYFRKGPFKAVPQASFKAVYLLDANGSELPDILLLSDKGIHYLRGLGKWRFWKESRRRLPFNDEFYELTFTDVNRDKFLDIFTYAKREGRGILWLNTFE